MAMTLEGKGDRHLGSTLSLQKFKGLLPLRVMLVLQTHRRALLPNTQRKLASPEAPLLPQGREAAQAPPGSSVFKDTW